jgi:hypothetical protein
VLAARHGGVTLPEDVVRREAEIAVALAPAHEDIEGIVFMLVILSYPTTPNSISVGSPLLIHGLEHFFMWRKLRQPYKASA